MKTNAIDQIRNMMGLTDSEAVDTLKAMGYTDEHIAIMRKADDEMTTEEKTIITNAVKEIFVSSLKGDRKKPKQNSTKVVTLTFTDESDGSMTVSIDYDGSVAEAKNLVLNYAFALVEDEAGIDISGVLAQVGD
ncbi:hypothetical protein [Lentilactobacillus senioris]|uniref:hypothetical protein n=1 Tax=Lentilactobacillus senioris TaxID=931534 RepID=UPI003D2D8050